MNYTLEELPPDKSRSINLSEYVHSTKNGKEFFYRILWMVLGRPVFMLLFPTTLKRMRATILRAFGAQLDENVNVYSSAKIWVPWNLKMGKNSCIGPRVRVYNQGLITIGSNTTISQDSTLCASTHDITDALIPLVRHHISIEDQVWVAAEAFIAPKVTIGQGAVVGARSAVFKDVESWTVVGGNPAKYLKDRILTK